MKMSKSIIFLVKSFLGNFWRFFLVTLVQNKISKPLQNCLFNERQPRWPDWAFFMISVTNFLKKVAQIFWLILVFLKIIQLSCKTWFNYFLGQYWQISSSAHTGDNSPMERLVQTDTTEYVKPIEVF